VVVVDGLVAGRAGHDSDDAVGRIAAQRDRRPLAGPAEVPIHGLPYEGRQRHAPSSRLVPELAVDPLGEAQVRRHQSSHRGITISEYRASVKELRASPSPRRNQRRWEIERIGNRIGRASPEELARVVEGLNEIVGA
jgi:hypothetical protein